MEEKTQTTGGIWGKLEVKSQFLVFSWAENGGNAGQKDKNHQYESTNWDLLWKLRQKYLKWVNFHKKLSNFEEKTQKFPKKTEPTGGFGPKILQNFVEKKKPGVHPL